VPTPGRYNYRNCARCYCSPRCIRYIYLTDTHPSLYLVHRETCKIKARKEQTKIKLRTPATWMFIWPIYVSIYMYIYIYTYISKVACIYSLPNVFLGISRIQKFFSFTPVRHFSWKFEMCFISSNFRLLENGFSPATIAVGISFHWIFTVLGRCFLLTRIFVFLTLEGPSIGRVIKIGNWSASLTLMRLLVFWIRVECKHSEAERQTNDWKWVGPSSL